MTLTKRKKRVKKERKKINPDEKCRRCGASLKNNRHHFYCNDCWLPKEIRYIPEKKLSYEGKQQLKRIMGYD